MSKIKGLLFAVAVAAMAFTVSCSSDDPGDQPLPVNTGALRAQPVAASNNRNEPIVLTSWRKEDVNWYVIDVGHIKNSLLMQSDYVRNQGVGSVTISMSETVEESMSKSRTTTVSESVVFFESATVSKNIQEVQDAKLVGKVGYGPFSVEGSVQKTITANYKDSVTVETTQGRTTETSEAIVQGLTTSKTNALSFTIDRTDPIGYYRYAWYTTSDVYFIISTSSDNQELLSWHTVSSPRAIGTQGIEYSENGVFDNSPVNGSEIVFAEDFYTKLPQPTNVLVSYCDFGVFNSYGGGCYIISSASECDLEWGTVRSSCPRAQYCDFGPITEYGGGCFEIDDANDCDLEWGTLTNSCGSPGYNGK